MIAHAASPMRASTGRRSTPWLGVDIGTHSVKLALVRPNRLGQWELAVAQRVPWPKGEDPFASASSLGHALERVLGETESDWWMPHLRAAAFCLPGCALSQQELAESPDTSTTATAPAAEAISAIYSARPDQLAYDDWQPHPSGNPVLDDHRRPHLVWADPDVVTRCLEGFRRFRLSAEVLDAPPLTTARASQMLDSGTTPTSELVIDWGMTGLTFTWLVDGQPQFTRTSHRGGVAELLESLCENGSLGVAEAELLLARYGLPGESCGGLNLAVAGAASETLQILLNEVDRTLSFLESRYPGQAIGGCLLMGGGAAIRNLEAWLTTQTGLPTRNWELPRGSDPASSVLLLPAPVFAHAAALSALAWES